MRSRARLLAVLIAGVTLVPAACSSSGTETITVKKDDSGQTVDVSVGDKLDVSLRGNDVTSYEWQVVEADDSILELENTSFDNDSAGSGGQQVFTYDVLSSGSTPVKAELIDSERPDAEPRESFEIDVVASG